MPIVLLITVVLASSGAFIAAMSFAHAKLPGRRSYPTPEKHLRGRKFWIRTAIIGLFSTILVYGLTFILADKLFYTRTPPWWRSVIDVVAILFVYDMFYYLMHRYPFHQWKFMMRVHAVHHQAHHPIPIHSMYLHPIENVLGIGLLLFTTWLIGPVNVYAFGVCFFVYSWLNVVTHSGMHLPLPYFDMLSRKHDIHHKHMKAGNYATLSPIPDMIFGTAE